LLVSPPIVISRFAASAYLGSNVGSAGLDDDEPRRGSKAKEAGNEEAARRTKGTKKTLPPNAMKAKSLKKYDQFDDDTVKALESFDVKELDAKATRDLLRSCLTLQGLSNDEAASCSQTLAALSEKIKAQKGAMASAEEKHVVVCKTCKVSSAGCRAHHAPYLQQAMSAAQRANFESF